MTKVLSQLACCLTALGMLTQVVAQESSGEASSAGFKFQKNDSFLTPRLSSALDSHSDSSSSNRLAGSSNQANRYDAIFYYPMHRQGVSIDVGVNLRMQEEYNPSVGATGRGIDWLSLDPSDTRPLIHAEAVFDLPFSGLKAGLSGAYNPDLANQEYDYRAKLSYKWRNGFGLEGGWQHQQNTFDQTYSTDSQEVQTLFLDMNYRF